MDLDGEERIQGSTVDMGAYEGGEEPPLPVFWKVNADADPGGSGIEWESAFNTLSDAIFEFYEHDQIWVAAGTYTGNFNIKDKMFIYGGFAGTEESLEERNWVENETILTSPAGTVVSFVGVSEVTVLDGFTITGGNGSNGGGIYNNDGSPQIANCTISGNSASNGGGMYNYANNVTVSPTFTNCTISGNSASSSGGGMYNERRSGSSAVRLPFPNCILWANTLPQIRRSSVTGDGTVSYLGTSV